MNRVPPTQERPATHIALTLLTVGLLLALLLLPLVVVFAEAASHGWRAMRDALTEPDAVAAVELNCWGPW
jgi:sulfate transport system permease protein